MSSPKPVEYLGPARRRSLPKLVQVERNLHVLQVGKYYPPHPGGMESHLQALCEELNQSVDLEVVVSASNDSCSTEEMLHGVRVARLGKLFDLRSTPFCPQMVRKIRDSNADVVHIHLPNPAAILAYLASGHRGRLVFTYHSDVIRQKVLGRLFDPLLHHALQRADAIIVSSSRYIDSSNVLPFFRHKCRVVPFGINVESLQCPEPAQVKRLRQQYGPRIVLGVGRLVYYKGFEYLIEAMRLVDARLLIVGRGPLLSGLKQKAESCGVRERVTFLTDVEDVTPYYHAADVFALPSVARSEAFGIVQLEAMACAKPVVNTNLNSGVPSVSLDGISGLTVPPADSGALGRAINSLLNDPVRSTAYGRAGLRRVERHFSLEMMTSETLSLYREITRYVASNIKPSPLSALTIIKPDDLKSVPAASIPVSARRGTEVSA